MGSEPGTPEEPTEPSPTEAQTDTQPPDTTEASPTGSAQATPGGENGDHWHGKLLVEVNGDRMNFAQSRYYDADPYIHFHEGEGRNVWHNEQRVVTFEYIINSVPGINYEAAGDGSVLTIDGTTYESSDLDTIIKYQQRDTEVDPSEHEVQDGDILWVLVNTNGRTPTPSSESETESGDSTETSPTAGYP